MSEAESGIYPHLRVVYSTRDDVMTIIEPTDRSNYHLQIHVDRREDFGNAKRDAEELIRRWNEFPALLARLDAAEAEAKGLREALEEAALSAPGRYAEWYDYHPEKHDDLPVWYVTARRALAGKEKA